MTLKDLKDQKRSGANKTKTKKTKQRKKQTESNSTPKSRRGAKEDLAEPKKNMTISQLKEYMYKGSGKDPAVNKLIEKLKKDGGGSLDSSGFGDRFKV